MSPMLMRGLLAAAILLSVSCGKPLAYHGVTLGMKPDDVRKLRPGAEETDVRKAIDEAAGGFRTAGPKYESSEPVLMTRPGDGVRAEVYIFERQHLRMVYVGYEHPADFPKVRDALEAENGKRSSGAAAQGSSAAVWERKGAVLGLTNFGGEHLFAVLDASAE